MSLFRQAAFVDGMFTMASSAVKNLPLEEQFPPDAVRHCHEARNIPCFNVLIQKDNNPPQATIDMVIENVGLANHFLNPQYHLKYKASSSSGMSGLDCTVTKSCLEAPFARSLYV